MRQAEDRESVEAMTEAIFRQYPARPPHEARRVTAHTAERGSGHVGRTAKRPAVNRVST